MVNIDSLFPRQSNTNKAVTVWFCTLLPEPMEKRIQKARRMFKKKYK